MRADTTLGSINQLETYGHRKMLFQLDGLDIFNTVEDPRQDLLGIFAYNSTFSGWAIEKIPFLQD